MTMQDMAALSVKFPKIELHRHLEGAIRLETLFEIGQKYRIDVPAHDLDGLRPLVQIVPNDPNTSEHFLKKFEVIRRFFCAPEVIRRFAREAVEDAAADGVKYMELRFTPRALTHLMGYSFDDVVRWVCTSVRAAQQSSGIQVKLIISMNRHESVEEGKRALRAALAFRSEGVVGIDLAGKEKGSPSHPFYSLFQQAAKEGLGITIHAGEWAGPNNIRDAILYMGAQRIGHGVRVVEDHKVVQLALEHKTAFEVCPTSNLQSGAIRRVDQYPLRDMTQLGLKTTLNTDDPGVSAITLSGELAFAYQHLGLTLDEIKQNILNAAQCAFLPEAEREALVTQIKAELAELTPAR